MSHMKLFRDALSRAGLDYDGPILADGCLHRFKAVGDHARNSWYVFYAGTPAAGAFGCWKRNLNEVWLERNGQLSQADWDSIRHRWQEAKAERERTEAQLQAKARKTAAWILLKARQPDGNAYLTRKGVQPHGELRQWRGALVVPLRDTEGTLHSLQFISADGAKRFLSHGHVAGCFFTLSDGTDGALVIAEGYATAASVYEATGLATVAAMNCGNLKAVAEAVRAKWPDRDIILAADNDAWTDANPGITKASEAAKAVKGKLAVPMFKDSSTRPTDFNDLGTIEGLPEVKRHIEAAAVPPETDDDTFTRLAKLTPAEYDRSRKAESDRLGIRAGTLDAEVQKLRPQADAGGQGFAVKLPDVEPWRDPVAGGEVLDTVAATLAHYVVLPPGAADALALWCAHCHCFEAFEHTPRLNLFSPEKGCGKTLTLDVLATLVPRPLRTESITAAVLFRLVESCKPTLLLDEVDSYLSEAEELRGLLNAGHKRGAHAYRCETDANTVRGFNAFAPAALAGIGHLPGTLHDRSVVVPLVRAKPGEIATRFDSRHTEAEHELCRKLARWCAENAAALAATDPRLPDNAFNRLADNWRPLFAIAEQAGGDWPTRAAAAFAKLTSADDTDAQGIGTLLLADIATIFDNAHREEMPSAELVEILGNMEGRPWPEFGNGKHQKPISTNQLANQLRKFGISSRNIRSGTKICKGYLLTDFADAFYRYLPQSPLPNRYTATSPDNTSENEVLQPLQPKQVLRIENSVPPNKDKACSGVADRTAPQAEKEALQGDLL